MRRKAICGSGNDSGDRAFMPRQLLLAFVTPSLQQLAGWEITH